MRTSRGLRMSTMRGGLIATVVVALALLLGGCTGTTTPPDDPTPLASTPSATPSPTPTPIAAPVRPEAMNTASVDGAIAAAKYFMEVYTYARQTGDLTEWNAMSADDCRFCDAVVVVVNAVPNGHRTTGSEISVTQSAGTEILKSESYSATLLVNESASAEVDSNGAIISTADQNSLSLYFALGWNGGGWVVRDVDVTPTVSSTP